MQNEKIIKKIKDLLSLSKSSNENEAKLAANLASKLITQYNISQESLDEKQSCIIDTTPIYSTKRKTTWKVTLLSSLASNFSCCIINYISLQDKVSNFCLIGRRSDIDLVKEMYNNTVAIIDKMADTYCVNQQGNYRSSYKMGFTSGIIEQITFGKNEVLKDAGSSAITLLDSRLNESVSYMNNMFPKLKSQKLDFETTKINAEAFKKGKQHGIDYEKKNV